MINVAICEDSDIDMQILKGIVESHLSCRNILYESRISSIIDKFGSQLFCLRSGLTQKIISQ